MGWKKLFEKVLGLKFFEKNLGLKFFGSEKNFGLNIWLIWTIAARTYVALTNVTMTVASFKHGPKNLYLKFGQNRISNS